MRIIIPGGSGQVGRILARHFHGKGHIVTVLRGPRPAPWRTMKWDGFTSGAWITELERSTSTPSTRKIATRSAITFSPDRGGVFDVLLGLVRHGLGGRQGPGTQFVSGIHEADFVRAMDLLIAREDFSGIVNLAAPNPLSNCAFMQGLRDAWGSRIGLPIPRWMIEIGALILRTESELVLKSRRIVPGRLLAAGFHFLFPEWPAAARELVSRWRGNLTSASSDIENQSRNSHIHRASRPPTIAG